MATPENTPDADNELKAIYEMALANVRAIRESERARLQGEMVKLRQKLQDLEITNMKKESDLAKALESLDSEATQRAHLQGEVAKLRLELQDLEKMNMKKESDLAKTREYLDSEATQRAHLQGEVGELRQELQDLKKTRMDDIQALKDELELQKDLHSAKLRKVQSQHESRMVELEAGHQESHDRKLADAMEIKSQLEHIQKEFAAKVKDLEEALSTERERLLQQLDERACQTMSARKKRKRPSEASSFPSKDVAHTDITQQASASRQGTMKLDRQDKYIRIWNDTDEDQNLGNCQVQGQVGFSAPIIFKFPAEFILKAGQTVTIWAAGAGGNHNPPSELVSEADWETVGLFQTTLMNANGEEMARNKSPGTHLEDDDGNFASTSG
ncbi:lamin-A-like isoform X2 [Syngnathus typhle]|uniref:lamin-A-like isoform X2 n=1 Tax=Syngnathus typhle TaxID=161592 RepID=UPI002A6A600A|nr:lamin-A-like isoform X2 [Syngnathus typhle]